MTKTAPADVDAYIAAAPAAARGKLAELRAFILTALPELEERIWYRVPFYGLNGRNLVGFSVQTAHVSFGFGVDTLSDQDRAGLKAKGYKCGKQTLQIRFDQPLPEDELRRILLKEAGRP